MSNVCSPTHTPTPDAVTPAGPRDTGALWRNVSFTLMWTSVAASGFGDRLIQLAGWSLLGMSLPGVQASSVQAGISFFFFLPYLFISPLGGWLADTLPRKWIMLACDESRGLLLLWGLLLVPAGTVMALGPEHHWKVYGLVLAVGCFAAVFTPTRNAMVPQVVPGRHLQAANAVILGIAVISSLIGLLVGGWMIGYWSLKAGLGFGVGLYMISGTFFAFMSVRAHPQVATRRVSQWRRMVEGAKYIHHRRSLVELVSLTILFWAAAQVFMASLAALCKQRYGIPDSGIESHIAYLGAATGFGMLSSSLVVAWINTRRESSWTAMAGLAVTGVCFLAMAVNPSFELGLALSFVTGFFGNVAMIVVATLMQSLAPDHVRGRVFGVREVLTTTSAVAVNLVIWQLPSDADRWTILAMYPLAGLLAVVGGVGLCRELGRGPMPSVSANVYWRLGRLYCLVWHRLRWVGRHHLPKQGPFILAANHTTGLDGFVLQAASPRPVRWVMLEAYLFGCLGPLWKAFRPITLALNDSDRTAIRRIVTALEDGEPVGIFPEGRLQRDHRVLGEFEPGVGLIARRSGAPIVPAWIDGTPRTHSMLSHFLLPSRTTVLFGRPFTPGPEMSNEQIAQELRSRMLELAASVPAGH
ncbi:MAG: MFS transporter [Phycisphaeraceae bacterium]|nr:MFS transporter [Phycisphaeraceae bacterium]